MIKSVYVAYFSNDILPGTENYKVVPNVVKHLEEDDILNNFTIFIRY